MTDIEQSSCARYWWSYLILKTIHEEVLPLSAFYRRGNQGTEKLRGVTVAWD